MIEKTRAETITIKGERFVLLPESDYSRLAGESAPPELPPADSDGYYPALESMRAIMARGIIKRRWHCGLTQAELARRAGIRPETLNRIERAVRAPSVATMDRIDAALREAEAEDTGD